MPGKNNVAKSAKVDSPEMNSKHNINEHFEILIHKALNIFARNPKEFAAVHSNLRAEVTRYGPAEKGLGDERFLTLEFFDAVTNAKEFVIFKFMILFTNCFCISLG